MQFGKFSAFLLLLMALLGLGLAYREALIPPLTYGKSQVFEVSRGSTSTSIAQKLEDQGIIRSHTTFLILGRLFQYWPKVKSGQFLVGPQMSAMQVFDILLKGQSIGNPFLIREGQNLYEIAQELQRQNYGEYETFIGLFKANIRLLSLSGFKQRGFHPTSLEGFLFPETYMLTHDLKPEAIAQKFVQTFFMRWKPAYNERAAALGWSADHILTLASMVEKETGVPEERPRIAGVFWNRLEKKMRLQSDPTSIYGVWESYTGNIQRRHLEKNHPWNTYQIPGLPIGPISNPGTASIEAALFPEKHDYFYFVSHNDGTHEFTHSYEEHQKAVQTFQLDRAAREGKSWRDRLKK